MPGSSPRTRLIFQNLNLYVGPAALSGSSATGFMYTAAVPGFTGLANSGSNLIAELANIQSTTLNVGINRQDVNVFGQLNRVDQIIIAPPTISLDFSYNATNGYNEQMIGLDSHGNSLFSGVLTKVSDSKNYFISISQQGVDDDSVTNPNQRDCYAVGNGFISNYSFNAAVGQVVTTSVTVEGLNVAAYTGTSGLQTPAIDPTTAIRLTTPIFQLPAGQVLTGGNTVFALRHGDITMSIPSGLGFIVPITGANAINIQSFSLSVPVSREIINRLGSPFGISREINFPVNCTMQVRALQTEVNPNSFDQLYCNDGFSNLSILLRQPSCQGTGAAAIIISFNNAKLANISNGFTIGGDATTDLSFTSQLAGSNSTAGVCISGYY